jgi:hypothetical protein
MRRLPALALMLALPWLAACLPGGAGPEPVGQPVEAISVTPLPDPGAAPPPEATPPADAAAPADAPEAEAAEAPDSDAAPAQDAIPAAPPSPQQLACERRGGRFMRAGDSGLMACVQTTRDGGQQCRRGSDCDGECLARSGTCAPFTPLFGCHEILQDDGARVTQCLD